MECDILQGIVVGGAGGAIAGLVIVLINWLADFWKFQSEKKRVYSWFEVNTEDQDGNRFRSTKAVASANNLTYDRANYICSKHPKIKLSTGQKEGMWTIFNI